MTVSIGHVRLDNPRIVATVTEVSEAKNAKREGADILELRIDLLRSKNIPGYVKMVRNATSLPLIVTCRGKKEGGKWKKSEKERIQMLLSAMEFADAVDIELSADCGSIIKKAEELAIPVIVSYHNFRVTPTDSFIRKKIADIFRGGADIAKVAVMPKTSEDVIRLLDVLRITKKPTVAIAMGEIGKPSRILAPLFGSVLSYGCVSEAKAPGQMRVRDMKGMLELAAFR